MDKYYELNVTVAPDHVLEFIEYCKQTKATPVYLQLANCNQLMLTVTHMLPDDKTALGWMRSYESYLQPHFTVLHKKLKTQLIAMNEAPAVVPSRTYVLHDVYSYSGTLGYEYYEANWKFPITKNVHYWRQVLFDLSQRHPCLLSSSNLLDPSAHYLSQRVYSGDPLAANEIFTGSEETLTNYYGFTVTSRRERCLFDSNPALDFGWA